MDGAGSASGRKTLPFGWIAAKPHWIPALVGLVVLGLDQVTKALIRGWIGPDAAAHRFDLAGDLLALVYVENPGAAFGILRGQTAFLILAAAAIVVLLIVALRDAARLSPLMYVGLGLLLGGALGNLIDRIRLGYVTDFIAVGIWPKFNVADSAITVGLILMGASYLIFDSEQVTGERQSDHRVDNGHQSE